MGAGIAGSLIVSGLRERTDCEVIGLERVGASDHSEAGTGLNIGPNAIKALGLHLPREAAAILANSFAWSHWSIALTSGEKLMDLPLAEVADNPGIRIRWAELYALLRAPLAGHLTYDAELTACRQGTNGPIVSWSDRRTGASHAIDDIDLLDRRRRPLLADPSVRARRPGDPAPAERLPLPRPVPRRTGLPDRRLRPMVQRAEPAARLPGAGGPRLLRRLLPHPAGRHDTGGDEGAGRPRRRLSPGAGPRVGRSRLSDRRHRAPPRRHPLGAAAGGRRDLQRHARPAPDGRRGPSDGPHARPGARPRPARTPASWSTRSALPSTPGNRSAPCRAACSSGAPIAPASSSISRGRATDTMLAGADPVAGTRHKTEPAFRRKLERLYRDVPLPRSG